MSDDTLAAAEELRLGPRGTAQRAALFGILTNALIDIDCIGRPWLDDCIWDTKQRLLAARESILAARESTQVEG